MRNGLLADMNAPEIQDSFRHCKRLLAQMRTRSTYDNDYRSLLEELSMEAILAALDDPYTVYMTAQEYQNFKNQVNGKTVVGIGVSVSNAIDDGMEILSVLDDSPALEAGLSAGDRILAVDGSTISGILHTIPQRPG